MTRDRCSHPAPSYPIHAAKPSLLRCTATTIHSNHSCMHAFIHTFMIHSKAGSRQELAGCAIHTTYACKMHKMTTDHGVDHYKLTRTGHRHKYCNAYQLSIYNSTLQRDLSRANYANTVKKSSAFLSALCQQCKKLNNKFYTVPVAGYIVKK